MAFSLEKDWDAPGLSLWVGLCLLGVLVFQCLRWERRSVRLGHWWTEVNRPWIALWAVAKSFGWDHRGIHPSTRSPFGHGVCLKNHNGHLV